MGLMAVYAKPRLSLNPLEHKRFPYLEPVPKVAVLKFQASREAWWEGRERVMHVGTPEKSLRCKF
jgi:hypothetical protein